MPHVVFIERTLDGHHGPYLVWMATALVERGITVTCVVPRDQVDSDAGARDVVRRLRDAQVDVRLYCYRRASHLARTRRAGTAWDALARARQDLRSWSDMREAYAWFLASNPRLGADLVIAPYLDSFAYSAAYAGSPFGATPWASMTFRARFHFASQGIVADPRSAFRNRLDQAVFWRTLQSRTCRGLFTPDATLAAHAHGTDRTRGRDVVLLLEPSVRPTWSSPERERARRSRFGMREAARARFGIASDRRLVLVYGVVGARKGIAALAAATTSKQWPAATDVLVAGRVQDDVGASLARVAQASAVVDDPARCRWHVVDRYVSHEEEHQLFAAADVVWTGYKGHAFSSAVMVRAAFERLPVVACNEGLIGATVRSEGLGAVVDVDDEDAVAVAVSDAVARPWQPDTPLHPMTVARSAEQVEAVFVASVERWLGESSQGRPTGTPGDVGAGTRPGRAVPP